jgi:hypothetical protein
MTPPRPTRRRLVPVTAGLLGLASLLAVGLAAAGPVASASSDTAPGPSPARRPVTLSTLAVPPAGRYYHGVYPGGRTGEEDDIRPRDLRSYERAVGHHVAWVFFSNNWYRDRAFPLRQATWIRDSGAVPYVRLMLRASSNERRRHDRTPDRTFSLQRIVDGRFDADLRRWADTARDFGTPVLAEYGTEMNGFWFGWNAVHNGRRAGAPLFRRAYRHIIDVVRAEGADNVSWVFHVNDDDAPSRPWNRLERYYPGDRYIDWLATSVYGAQTPREHWNEAFARGMDRVYPRLVRLADKPIIVAELGVTRGNPRVDPPRWARAALNHLIDGRWPRVRGFSWWNERWQNDDIRAHDSDLRVQDIPGLPGVFRTALDDARVLNRPLL